MTINIIIIIISLVKPSNKEKLLKLKDEIPWTKQLKFENLKFDSLYPNQIHKRLENVKRKRDFIKRGVL